MKNVNLRFVTKDSLFESRREYVQASNNVSFEVHEGETFGLVGESGSGKSTIARVIAGLYEPNSGQVKFEGIDLTAMKSEKSVVRCDVKCRWCSKTHTRPEPSYEGGRHYCRANSFP